MRRQNRVQRFWYPESGGGAGRTFARCADPAPVSYTHLIDTWAVDFLLLEADGTPIGDPVAYRDGRTAAMREELEPILPFTKLYARTGIQYQSFNRCV